MSYISPGTNPSWILRMTVLYPSLIALPHGIVINCLHHFLPLNHEIHKEVTVSHICVSNISHSINI